MKAFAVYKSNNFFIPKTLEEDYPLNVKLHLIFKAPKTVLTDFDKKKTMYLCPPFLATIAT